MLGLPKTEKPMNSTPAELDAFRRSVRRRRATVWTVIAVAIGVAVVLHERGGGSLWFAVVFGVAAIICVTVWRCPRCGRVIKRNLMARECSYCELQFDHE